jgi:hypothetical protein
MGALTGAALPGDPYRNVYQMALSYEAGDWDAVTALAAAAQVNTSQIADAYAESTFWAQQALHVTLRKTNSRRHVRYSAIGEMRLMWEQRTGRERVIPATLVNASLEGLQLQISEKIPVRSCVSCDDAHLGISGRGGVRYCNYVKGKYLIGVEFRGKTGVRGPAPALR